MRKKITEGLHEKFLHCVTDYVVWHSDTKMKPLLVDLKLPCPPRLRVYMYSLVGGIGTTRPNEFKAILRIPGQPVGEYGSFDNSDDRMVLLVAYREELDVFVLWDASLHHKFKNGGNIQVRDDTVYKAAVSGQAYQVRRLTDRTNEIVIACQSRMLSKSLAKRIGLTGGMSDIECQDYQS